MDDEIIHKIYRSVTDDSLLPELMKDLETIVRGSSSALVIATPEGSSLNQTNVDPDIVEAYNTYYGLKDRWVHRASKQKPGAVLSGRHSMADHSEFDPEYLNDMLIASDTQDCLATILFNSSDSFGSFAIYRSFSEDPFQKSDIELMSGYFSHLRHAISLRAQFADLSAEVSRMKDALSHINAPLLLLQPNGRVAWANAKAEKELSYQSTIRLQNNRLIATNDHFTSKFKTALRSVLKTGQGATVPMSMDENGGLAVMYLTPLHDEISDAATKFTFSPERGKLVLAKLMTAQKTSQQAKATLKSVFSLTDRQIDVVSMLAEGYPIPEIATHCSISLGTTRNHVKAIFEKTGTSRQAELVRLVLAL